MDLESKPTTTFSLEAAPGRGASQDGAWTETDSDGAWTEPFLSGAYTADDAYMFEGKPMTTWTLEAKPTSTTTAGQGAGILADVGFPGMYADTGYAGKVDSSVQGQTFSLESKPTSSFSLEAKPS